MADFKVSLVDDVDGGRRCCGRSVTRNQKLCCYSCCFLLLGLISFYAYRVVQLFQMADTSAVLSVFEVSDLCDPTGINIRLAGSIDNPGVGGIALQPGTLTISDAGGEIARVETPAFEIQAGVFNYDISVKVVVCDLCISVLRFMLQQFIDGGNPSAEISFDIVADVGPSVLLFPLSLNVGSLTSPIAFFLRSSSSEGESSGGGDSDEAACGSDFSELIRTFSINDGASAASISTVLSLNDFLFPDCPDETPSSGQIQFDPTYNMSIPDFEVFTLWAGQQGPGFTTDQFTLATGGKEAVSAQLLITDAHIGVIQSSLTTLFETQSAEFGVRIAPTPPNETCFVKRLLGGIEVTQEIDLSGDDSGSGSGSSSGSGSGSGSANSTGFLAGLEPFTLQSVQENVFSFALVDSLDFLSIVKETRINVPSLFLNVTKVVGSDESDLMSIDTQIEAAETFNASATVTILPYDDIIALDLGEIESVVIQSTATTVISRMIPRIEIPLGSSRRRLQSSSSTPGVDVRAELASDATSGLIRFTVSVLEDVFPLRLGLQQTTLALETSGTPLGSIHIPESTFGLTGSGTGPGGMLLTLSGTEWPNIVDRLVSGDSTLPLTITGTTGGQPFVISFTVPSGLVDPLPSVFTVPRVSGRRRMQGDEGSTFLSEVMLLGGEAPGEDIVLPCLLDPFCTNQLEPGRDENVNVSAMTFGVSFGLPGLGDGSAFDFSFEFQTDVCMEIGLNGFDLMQVSAGSGFKVSPGATGYMAHFAPKVRFAGGADKVADLRHVLNSVLLPRNDMVVSLQSCSAVSDYINALLNRVPRVDVEVVEDAARRMLGEERDLAANVDCFFCFTVSTADRTQERIALADLLPLTVDIVATEPKRLTVDLGLDLLYTQLVMVPMGAMELGFITGHDGAGENGFEVATVSLQPNDVDVDGTASFAISGSDDVQTFQGRMTLQYDTPTERTAMNEFVSSMGLAFVDKGVLPLEAVMRVTPPANASKYDDRCTPASACSFNVQTWMTLKRPPREAANKSAPEEESTPLDFFDELSIDYGLTLCRMFGLCGGVPDFQLQMVLRVVNTLTFDVIMNSLSFEFLLHDTDGLDRDDLADFSGAVDCAADLNGATITSETPGSSTPVNVLESNGPFTLGNPTFPFADPFIAPGRGGDVTMAIDFNPSINTAGRMADEFFVKSSFCADLANGRLVLGLQSNPACSDSSNPSISVDGLQCTFLLDIPFNVANVPLLPLQENILSTGLGGTLELPREDSCGGLASPSAQEDPSNPLGFDSGYSSFTLVSGMSAFNQQLIDPGCSVDEEASLWRLTPVSVADSFRLNFTSSVVEKCFFGGAGEGYSIVFKIDQPASTTSNFFDSSNRREAYKGIDRSIGFGFYHTTGVCNEFRVLKNGILESQSSDALLARSQSLLGSRIIGTGHPVSIHYDSALQRVRVSFQDRYHEFDLDIPHELQGARRAYIGFVATAQSDDGSTMTFSDVTLETTQTSSSNTVLAGPKTIKLFKSGDYGDLFIQTRDPEGRPRGVGGNLLKVIIVDAETGAPADITRDDTYIANLIASEPGWYCAESASVPNVFNACVFDFDDGSYRIHYRINQRGRYRVTVECEPASPDCIGTTPSEVTNALFVRA